VNDLSNEIEQLEIQIGELKEEVKRYQGKSSLGTVDEKKKRELKELEEKLAKTELAAEQFELDY